MKTGITGKKLLQYPVKSMQTGGPCTFAPKGLGKSWIIVLTTWAGILTALALAVLARRNARLRRLGTTDALTGVYNRNGGDWAVKRYLESHDDHPALVMAVDIDNFKIINDVYGHEAGDRALCQFTKDMKKIFGRHTFITRNGGDEFIIFYGDSLTGEAARAIDRFTGEPHEITYKGKKIQFYSSWALPATRTRTGTTETSASKRTTPLRCQAERQGKVEGIRP